MAKFVFELDPVLRQREREERERQKAVAVLERQRLDLEAEIRTLHERAEQDRAELTARFRAGGPVDVRSIRQDTNAALAEEIRTRRAALRLAGVHKQIEAARRALLEAATRRRAVELLRDQRFEAWKAEQRKREATELDELAVMRHGRGNMGL